MLTIYFRRLVGAATAADRDGGIIAVSSNGRAKHQSRRRNPIANPDCEVFANGQRRASVAAATEAYDRAGLHALAEGYYSGDTTYALNTDGIRTIPVMRLTPSPRRPERAVSLTEVLAETPSAS